MATYSGIELGSRPVPLALAAIFLLTCSTSSSLAAPKCEPERVAEKYPALAGKTLIVEQDGQSPPFTYRDPNDPDKIIGFDADYVRAAMACIGAKSEFKLGAWSGLLPALAAGQADFMWSNLYYTPERAKTVNFVTYMQAASAGLVAKGNPKNIKSTDDFCGVRGTAGVGTVEYTQLQDISKKCTDAGKPPVDIVTFPDVPAGARLVANDRADVLYGDLTLAGKFTSEMPDKVEIVSLAASRSERQSAMTTINFSTPFMRRSRFYRPTVPRKSCRRPIISTRACSSRQKFSPSEIAHPDKIFFARVKSRLR